MMLFMSIAIALSLLYFFIQIFYLYNWLKTPVIVVPGHYIPSAGISVVVVAHNEENTIHSCIRDIVAQNYPVSLFEVIVVNDRSTDSTGDIVQKTGSNQVRLFNLTDHPEFIHAPAFKKSGISLAVQHARHEWIVVTDADCTYRRDWLRTISYAKESGDSVFIAAPIQLNSKNSFLEKMQQMENLAFMVITAAGIRSGLHVIANGANMAFSKRAFMEIKGFEGNYHYASGDDMFLIEKMKKHFPDQIIFLKSASAVVTTSPKSNWKSLITQRIRWAGKNKGLQNPVINIIWGFVGLYSIALVASLILPFISNTSLMPFIILFITKWILDFIIVQNAAFSFNHRPFEGNTIVLQFLYTFYVLRLGWNLLLGRKGDW